ncbi:15284_t:CDS:2, partial [Funneliformis geosporum]
MEKIIPTCKDNGEVLDYLKKLLKPGTTQTKARKRKNNELSWGNNSPVTHSSTPWAKMILKSLSLREIQEMEPLNENCCVHGYYSFHRMISKEESTPSNSSYGIIGPNLVRLLLSTSPVVSTLAFLLRSNYRAGTNSYEKRYADAKPESISMNTVVGRKSSNRAQSNNATINVVSKPAKRFDRSSLGYVYYAQYNLGRLYEKGEGTIKDLTRETGTTRSLRLAFKWYREAVDIASQIK